MPKDANNSRTSSHSVRRLVDHNRSPSRRRSGRARSASRPTGDPGAIFTRKTLAPSRAATHSRESPDRSEIPTPEMAKRFPHLEAIADEIPPLDRNAAHPNWKRYAQTAQSQSVQERAQRSPLGSKTPAGLDLDWSSLSRSREPDTEVP